MVPWYVLGEEKVKVAPASGEVIQRHTGKNKIVLEMPSGSTLLGQGKPKRKPSIFHFGKEEAGTASVIIIWCQEGQVR